MDKRFSLGIVRSKQTRLRGFGGTAGAVGFVSFAGDSVAVKRRVREQVKSLWRETKLVLGDWQASFAAFHGGCSFVTNPPGKRWDTSRAGQSKCRCETGRKGAAKPAACGSNGIQAATTAPSRCATAFPETESKPTCRQPGTIPKSAVSRGRASQ